MVESLGYLETRVRRDDNSIMVIPNHSFTTGEVVNWSRTPYKLFKTIVTLPMSALGTLPKTVESIRKELTALEGVEKEERDLEVSATGFSGDKIVLSVSCHFKNAFSEGGYEDDLNTAVTNVIASAVRDAK